MQVIHPSHRPLRKDIINRKLRNTIFRFIFDFINKNLINKSLILNKFSFRFLFNSEKKFNERLLKMKISDIIYEQENDII